MSVDFIIVTHNSRTDLERYLEGAIAAAEAMGAAVIVVDNGSTDGALELLAGAAAGSDRVEVLDLGANRGYAVAVNAGAARSNAEFLMILNPDIEVPGPEPLARLAGHLRETAAAAIAAPRLLNPDGSIQASARVVPTLGMLVARQTRLGRSSWGSRRTERYLRLPPETSGTAEPEWVLGAALAVRRSDFDAVGGWDERFFLYFEDVDFCVRLRKAGREVHYLPEVALVHDHRQQSRRERGSLLRSRARRAHVVSALRFMMKHPRYAFRRGLLGGGRS